MEVIDRDDFTLEKAILVNAIVDFNSFCTGVVYVNGTEIIHVRNLDFDYPEEMQKLMYVQVFVNREGVEIAKAPSIANFYGVYTLLAQNYSMSYNVRFG